ncbi:MAG: hypothetical protein Q9M36_09360 [Sulfurovum sp.]|nr:hypothetical protein [Sulfurovum sp.]
MQLLEYYQNQRPSSEYFVPRKTQIPTEGYLNLYGVRGSGKTSIALDYLDEIEHEHTLYIDFSNPNLLLNTLESSTLQNYIETHKIQILVLDHYHQAYLSSFPTLLQCIILTRIPLCDDRFIKQELFPLDYEEFLAFEQSSLATKGFNHFLRSGTLPLLARSQKQSTQAMNCFFQSAFDSQEQKLLLLLAQHHTQHLSTHQIYTLAKEQFKVSKDWLYQTIKDFHEEKLILLINDRHQKSRKKMLLFDFAFAKYLTLGQPFILQFDSMIALALMKHNIPVETLGIHGYITHNNELILPAPFESEESLWIKSQKKFSHYKKTQYPKSHHRHHGKQLPIQHRKAPF